MDVNTRPVPSSAANHARWSAAPRWTLVLAVGLLTAACGATAASSSGAATPTPSTTTPSPTPEPTVPLTVQAAFTVADADHLDVAGSSVPGAALATSVVSGAVSGLSGQRDPTAVADPQGNFALHFTGLPMGDAVFALAAVAAGYSTGNAIITITRTISPAAYKASAARIAYNQLVKDPAALAGRIVTYTGQVFQYDTNTTTSHMIVAVTNGGYGFWSDNVWLDVDAAAAANVCRDTIVQFWGDVVGAYSYTTTSNGTLTIPEIKVVYITATQKGC